MSAYVQDTQYFTRRTVVLFAIIGLHLLLLWAFVSGLANRAVEMVAPPIKTTIVRQTQKHLKPPPPPPPQLQQQQVQIPPPVVQINVPPAEQTHAITVVKRVVRAPPAPPPPVRITPLSPGRGMPPTDNYYPDASRRLGEQGTAMVKICVGPNGRLSSPPQVVKSSGSPRLDQAAVQYADATSGHWNPERRNGTPVNFCGTLPVKFQLNDF
jgi:protein TonB